MVRFMCNGKLFLEDVFQKMCRKFIFIDVFLSSLHHYTMCHPGPCCSSAASISIKDVSRKYPTSSATCILLKEIF